MNRSIAHRGPDDEGIYLSGDVGLGIRRLSIIDLHTGQQPVANEDGTVWIVCNGEIYNYSELRERLLQCGHLFRGHSDTEVIVHLYEEYGPEFVKHLHGMFAFALWDQNSRRLLLARDRLGIKPLYYTWTQDAFVFGSEIKALLEFPGVGCEFNRRILPEYLAFGYVSGGETFFSGVHCVPPGHTLELDHSGNASLEQYWNLPLGPEGCEYPRTYYVERYRQLFEQSVSSHLMSDVPLGLFLSGGLDSSAVAAVATKIRGPMETFSVGYDEARYSELPFARRVASQLGSTHHEVLVGPKEFFEALPTLIWHEDKPITWPSSVSLYFVARLARERVTVVLTGEGSDETLAGYERYALTLWNVRCNAIYQRTTPERFRRWLRETIATAENLDGNLRRKLQHTFLGRVGSAWESLYFDNFLCAFSEAEQRQLLLDDIEPGAAYANSLAFLNESSGDVLRRMLYTDMKTYLVELLMKQDRMSMAASVESRVPFLDHELVEFAATIPARFSLDGMAGKQILKSAISDLVTNDIVSRRKMGFPTPWKQWLSGHFLGHVERLLTEPRATARGLFKPEAVRQLLEEHKAGRHDHAERLWRLMNLELWHRVFMDAEKSQIHIARQN